MLKLFFGMMIGIVIVWILTRFHKPAGAGPNTESIEQKQKNLDRVMQMAREKGEISNGVTYQLKP